MNIDIANLKRVSII